MTRTEARESLFLLLFESTFSRSEDLEQVKALAREYRDVECDEYVDKSLGGIMASLDEIDAKISPLLKKMTLNRLCSVARTAMRIAIYEIDGGEVPASVAINEAVNLVKKYDTEETAKYVNGVLGSYVRQ